jgi:hypothetical protein
MTRHESRRVLEALAGEHGLPILRFLHGRDWSLASEVAHGLSVHTSTASKYLDAFFKAGFLDRAKHVAKRPTHAYRLKSPVIRLEFDLAERVGPSESREFAFAFAEAFLGAAERLGGPRLAASLVLSAWGAGDWRTGLETQFAAESHPRAGVDAILRGARRAATDLLGASAGGRLVRIAWSAAVAGREEFVASLGLAEVTA